MKKLTKKQQGFLKDYVATGNATEAAARNYDVKSRDVANTIGAQNLAKLSITTVLEKNVKEEEMDRKWVMRGTKELAEQRKELNVALGAYKFIAELLRLVNGNTDTDRTTLPGDTEARSIEARRGIEALAKLAALPGSRFALFVESGDSGIRLDNGETPQGGMPFHRDVEQT